MFSHLFNNGYQNSNYSYQYQPLKPSLQLLCNTLTVLTILPLTTYYNLGFVLSTLDNILSESIRNLKICIQKNIVVLFLYCYVNTIHVKDILNKDLSTPLIYICSTVYKMAKILTQKYLLQSFFHITCIYCKKSK